MQAIGSLRWPFLLAVLADTYNAPHASVAARTSATLVFQAVDQLAGVALTEHLFYLLVGAWSIAVGWYLLRQVQAHPARGGRWVAWLGVISGAGFWLSSVEQFDVAVFAMLLLGVVVVSRVLWGVWMISLAWSLPRWAEEAQRA